MTWRSDIQQASFRGVPFGVLSCTVLAGRNTAIHAYPYREDTVVWVEDLGLAPRRMQFVGFLVGDDVVAQQEAMLAAVEEPGSAELVHPLLGSVTVSVVGFSTAARVEKGRAVELTFDLVQQDGDASPFPDAEPDTGGDVEQAATEARGSVLGDIGRSIDGAVGGVIRTAQGVVREVRGVVGIATRIAGAAGSAFGAVRRLAAIGGFNLGRAGSFGRFDVFSGIGRPLGKVQAAIGGITALRRGVGTACASLSRLASGL